MKRKPSLLVLSLVCLAVGGCATAAPVRPESGAASAPSRPTVACPEDRAADVEPSAALEAECTRDPACGCATLGHALLMASDGAVEARALEALDRACRRGVVTSCNEVAMVEELCVRGTARPSPACDVLEQQGRVGSSEMQAP